ncbi:MAG: hypothetical protein AVDCRST_MAG64-387, partial [uncultured Phycisphaerae bacterium]
CISSARPTRSTSTPASSRPSARAPPPRSGSRRPRPSGARWSWRRRSPPRRATGP